MLIRGLILALVDCLLLYDAEILPEHVVNAHRSPDVARSMNIKTWFIGCRVEASLNGQNIRTGRLFRLVCARMLAESEMKWASGRLPFSLWPQGYFPFPFRICVSEVVWEDLPES